MIDLIRTCTQRVTAASLIIDAGANIGGYTHTFVEHTPARAIHAFEAIPALAKRVAERFKDEPRVSVFAQGLSDHAYTEPEMSVYEAWTLEVPGKSPRGPSLGALEEVGATFFPVEFTTVDAHMDRVVASSQITWGRFLGDVHTAPWTPPVHCLKLDVDGFEHRVLLGATRLLKRARPLVLLEVGYLIADKGDSIAAFLTDIYDRWKYVLVTQAGEVWATEAAAREKYPYHTTHDVAMLPKEQLARGQIRLVD